MNELLGISAIPIRASTSTRLYDGHLRQRSTQVMMAVRLCGCSAYSVRGGRVVYSLAVIAERTVIAAVVARTGIAAVVTRTLIAVIAVIAMRTMIANISSRTVHAPHFTSRNRM